MKTFNLFILTALICLLSLIKPNGVLSQPQMDSIINFYTLSDYYDQFYDSLIQLRGAENMQGTGYKDYLRWKWFYGTRHGVDGELDEIWKSMFDYYENFQPPQEYVDNSDWQFMGPLGIPLGHGGTSSNSTGKGMMLSIWVSEGDHSLMYAGSHHSGLWKTTDGGENWYPLHDNDARIHGVNSIAVDPDDNDKVYITCDNSLPYFSNYSSGLYKSLNGGNSWEQVIVDNLEYPTAYWGARVRKITIHPNLPNKLYFTSYKNVFMSEDEGENWTPIFNKNYYPWNDTVSNNFDEHNGMFDFEIDSRNDSLYYLAGSEIYMIKDSLNVIDTINLSEEIYQLGL